MKTQKQSKQKRTIKGFGTLKKNELLKIKGGDGSETLIDIVFPR